MYFSDLSLNKFLSLISSKESEYVGGSVLAYTGAISSAIFDMVACISKANPKNEEYEPLFDSILKDTQRIKFEFLSVCSEDAIAFKKMLQCFKMPKTTQEEISLRNRELQNAFILCAKPSLDIMSIALDCIRNIQKLFDKTNNLLITDLGISALNLKSVVQGAHLNVVINTKYIDDKKVCDNYKSKSQMLLFESVMICDKIYKDVLEIIQ